MLCRLCVNECTDYTDIFNNDENEIDIPKLISSYFTFEASQNDDHTTKVCRSCYDSLSNFNAFCKSIEIAQEKWKIFFDIKPKSEDGNSKEVLEFPVEPDLDNNSTVQNIETAGSFINQSDDGDDFDDKEETSSQIDDSDKKSARSRLSDQFDRLIAANSNLFCNDCNAPMDKFKDLKKHFKIAHGKSGFMICCKRKFFRAADLADHINLHLNPDYFKCQICDKSFASRYSLYFHQKTSHDREQEKEFFKCKHCPRKFLTHRVRDKHEESHNLNDTDDKKHVCMKCGKSYPNEVKLKAHDFNVHTTVYRRMCHLCGKTVRGNKALERHQLQHSGIKPKVKCNICGAELSTKGILKAHMIALHPEDSNVTYECKICGKNSPSERALKNHMDYVHKWERSHKCTFCDKSFKKVHILKEHMATHTGDRLFECPHCPKTFKARSHMHRHRKLKHPKEFEENREIRIESRT